MELEKVWNDYPYAVTISDNDGIILYMNRKAEVTFEKEGGRSLIGTNMFECHSPASQKKIREMLTNGTSNTYTIEKKGQKKLIHQAPWFEDGKVAGLVELSIVLPAEMPHFIRG
jgi:transcriptional regulator with PAS, ATPase and Fis domain